MFVYVWVGLGFFLSLLTSSYDAMNMFFHVPPFSDNSRTERTKQAWEQVKLVSELCIENSRTESTKQAWEQVKLARKLCIYTTVV